MTEKGFAEMLRSEGYIGEGHEQLTWEQVEAECVLIEAKKSNFSSDARKVFVALKAMKDSKIRLPPFMVPQDALTKTEEEAAPIVQE